ncbi:PadR family transcriptional regulator, partial [Kitasatospora sp. NPDC059571]|uniref:PadR family transcriptional regulator n=1 Tax=Kitasatospora sp. NPDC059571 TaxID=3346871 RepID=UPI0036837A38
MAKRRKVANPLALAVLAELVAEPMHPYEMGRRLKEHGKDRDIRYTRSSLYMVVEQLRKAGFVAAQETVRDTQRPERTVYALTDDGRSELHDWMRELVAEPQHEYPLFGVALSLLAVLPPLEAGAPRGAGPPPRGPPGGGRPPNPRRPRRRGGPGEKNREVV